MGYWVPVWGSNSSMRHEGETMQFTTVQVKKARDKLAGNMAKANTEFRDSHAEYRDVELNADDVRLIAVLDGDDEKTQQVRMQFVLAGRDTATIDLVSVKTESNVAEDDKFIMVPYLAAKRYRYNGSVWKTGYGNPCGPSSDSSMASKNSFIALDGSTFQVLRAKRLFQLMSDQEIMDYTAQVEVTPDLYFQLFL